jgi:hypothetical protein
MLPEYKQVMAIRAWTYLQLVSNYGEVPYITEPITSLDIVDKFSGAMLNKDNIVSELIDKSGLAQFSDKVYNQYPVFGNYQNGAVTIHSSKCYFYPDIIMGDIYLLGGQYDKAAQSYYDYLSVSAYRATLPNFTCSAMLERDGDTYYSNSNYLKMYKQYSQTAGGDEIISAIPGASNARFGRMLTEHVNLCGFKTSSSVATTTTTDDAGKTTSDDAGTIKLTVDYTKQQIAPSDGFYTLSGKQTYVNYNEQTGYMKTVDGGDARKGGSGSSVKSSIIFNETPSGQTANYHFINKFSANGITYMIPVYRKAQIYLRLAEAINRAGHPEYAFAILKDGLSVKNIPTFKPTTEINVTVKEDGTEVRDTVSYNKWTAPQATSGGAYYIDSLALLGAQNVSYLDFQANKWDNNLTGIHARGCGETSGTRDTVYTYAKVLANYAAAGHSLTTKADTIDAIENCIVDEMGLELSFEGYRFSDLERVAYHKTQAGSDGVAWFADKIARRNDNGAADYSASSAYQTLYQKLLNKNSWYLPKPDSYK